MKLTNSSFAAAKIGTTYGILFILAEAGQVVVGIGEVELTKGSVGCRRSFWFWMWSKLHQIEWKESKKKMERCERESVLTKSGEGEEDGGCEAAAQCSKLKKRLLEEEVPNPYPIPLISPPWLWLCYIRLIRADCAFRDPTPRCYMHLWCKWLGWSAPTKVSTPMSLTPVWSSQQQRNFSTVGRRKPIFFLKKVADLEKCQQFHKSM